MSHTINMIDTSYRDIPNVVHPVFPSSCVLRICMCSCSYSLWGLCSWTAMFQGHMFWSRVPRILFMRIPCSQVLFREFFAPRVLLPYMFSDFYVPGTPHSQCSWGPMLSELYILGVLSYLSGSKMFPAYPYFRFLCSSYPKFPWSCVPRILRSCGFVFFGCYFPRMYYMF